jgi:imidazolonepropionase-like amidohydrolase/Tol biopolymer transport system component
MMYKQITLFSTLFFGMTFVCLAQDKDEKKKWDVSNPPGTFKDIEFTTTEGTWMDLDISPDGKTIVFDLLGDIYSMPVSGGEARALREGVPFDVQPRFSTDGKKISFTSDAGGGDNIWSMNADGTSAKQITKESFRLLNNAVWMPGNQYLIARKHFTSTRSLGAGELWMYHISGGEGVQLTKRKNDQQDLGEPCISPDGKYVYYSEDVSPGPFFQYNKDPNGQIYAIKRYSFEKGESEFVTGANGGAVRPQISRDGKLMAFVRRVREKSVLFIHDLNTGEEWPLYDKLSKDQQETWAIHGVYSNFNWSPDSKSIIIWAKGKLWTIDLATSLAKEIPFSVHVKKRIYDALKFEQQTAPEQFTCKMIRQAVTSPDGKNLVFNAAGFLWIKLLPGGTPQRLTSNTGQAGFEFEPSFSADGSKILYDVWNDEQSGAIMCFDLKSKTSSKLSQEKGIFRTPRFSGDGKWIVYQKEEGNDHQGNSFCVKPGLYVMDANTKASRFILDDGFDPYFSADNSKLFFQSGGEDALKTFKVYDLSERKTKTLFSSKYANSFVPSPDNKWIAFTELFNVYIAALSESGKSVELGHETTAVPVARLSRDAGINLNWSADSKKLHWTLGDEYFTNELKNRFTFVEGGKDSLPPIDTAGIKIGLILNTDKPAGLIALKGARIITMKGDEVIENGTILIRENRIEEIGNSDKVVIPKEAKIMDMTGKTIMPGMVDVHAHMGTFRQGLSPQKQWSYYANLAYGVTTTHDPSSNTEMVFSQSEMVKAGYMVGPRIFSTGWILYGAEGDFKAVINSLDDARSAIARTKAYGAFSVKSYNQPRREQRQQVIAAARALHIQVVPEGGSMLFQNLTQIIDGHTGVEHNLPVADLHDDVVQLWKNSRTAYTPTLIVAYGAANGEYYWYQKTDVWANKKLLNFTPRSVIDPRSRRRTLIPEDEYEAGFLEVSRSCKKLADAGVKINLGAHGQLQGLGAHWELWMLQMGGMSPMQALRCATMNGAEYLGMSKDIGSLEKGKLADLVILDKNPLENIRNSESVRYTMVNGRLFDTETMNEIGNYDRKRGKFYWEDARFNASFPLHEKAVGDRD